jgi:predicted TIM-barrel fold metal-dependent hydrolase
VRGVSSSPVVDVHAHVSETTALGAWSKEGYAIWEYGEKDVAYSPAAGDLDDLLASMRAGGVDHAVIVNAFSAREWIERAAARLEPRQNETLTLGERLIAFNRWLVEAVASIDELTPFVAVDPWVLSSDALIEHLAEMRDAGARGVKIHPVEQRFPVSDPRMLPVYRACSELELTVLSHSGPTRDGSRFAEPSVFATVLRALPDVRLVLAHLGGAAWREVPALAADHAEVAFDLSEIVEWTGAPNAPTEDELVSLIRRIGVERVLFGTDFPWYEPGETVKRVRMLPGLSEREIDAILGENAVRILSLHG